MGLRKGTFRRRTEALDWRKIASLDLEKVLADPDGNVLNEILPQITYCQAEVEFDQAKTDPGFRKVFQLSQMIIENLQESQQAAAEKAATFEFKCLALVQENQQYAERIKVLNEKLVEAKRELKKRKELIVSNQTEILGRNNNDEFDQCPYCTKKFMTTVYLYSHLQRRHQGLPIHPVFNSQNQIVHQNQLNLGILAQPAKPMRTSSVTLATQTEEESNKSGQIEINLQTVNNLVDAYLQQKTEENDEKLRLSSLQAPDIGMGENVASCRNSVEETEERIVAMTEGLENQFKNVVQKIQQTEIELKGTVIDEMHKILDIIANKNIVSEPVVETPAAPSPLVLNGQIERVECLHENIQSPGTQEVHGELSSTTESKLESQERFWISKLGNVEKLYTQQINWLLEKVPISEREKLPQDQPSVIKSLPVSPIEPVLPRNLNSIMTPPKTSVKPPEITKKKPSPTTAAKEVKPVPKPRKAFPNLRKAVPNPKISETETEKLTSPNPQRRIETPNKLAVPVNPIHHEYEEPLDNNNSEHVSDYSFSEPSLSDTELSELKKIEKQEKIAKNQMSQMDLLRNRVLNNMKDEMDQLGISPDGSELLKGDMSKALGRMKHQRTKIQQNVQEVFATERQTVKLDTQSAAKTKTLEERIGVQITKQPAPPIPFSLTTPTKKVNVNESKSPNTPKSPLVKMFNALKNCDIKKKISFLRRKRPRSRLLIPNPSPRKVQKKSPASFFRRHRNKKGVKTGKADLRVESSDEFSSGETPDSLTKPNTVLVKDKKRRVSRTNRHLSNTLLNANSKQPQGQLNVVTESETDNDADDVGHKLGNKSDTSSWRSSELNKNAKEAIKKSTIPIVSQISVANDYRRSSITTQRQVNSRSLDRVDKSYDTTGKENLDFTNSDSSLPRKDTKKASARAAITSTSDSEAYERPVTAVRKDDRGKGQYVSLKVPEPKVIVYNKPSKNLNVFGLPINDPYADVPDFFSSTPIRNPEAQKPSNAKVITLSPISSKPQPTQKDPAKASAVTGSSASDWDNDSEDFSAQRVEYPQTVEKREDFVVHSPKKPAGLPLRPQPVLTSPKKSPIRTVTKKVTTSPAPPKNVASPLKRVPPPWSVSTHSRPPTASSKNTKHTPSSASPRKWD